MIRTRLVLIAASVLATIYTTSAVAEQQVVVTPGGAKVAHTRIAPVVMHRALPPFRGQHVYHGRSR